MKSFAFPPLLFILLLLFSKSRGSVVPRKEPPQSYPRSPKNASAPGVSAGKESLNMTRSDKISVRRQFKNDSYIHADSSNITYPSRQEKRVAFIPGSFLASSSTNSTVSRHATDRISIKGSETNSIHVSGENKLFKDSSENITPRNHSEGHIDPQSLLSKTSDDVRRKARQFLNSLRKKTLNFLTSQTVLTIPEQSIESQYLQFVERGIDKSSWHVRFFRYVTESFDAAISRLTTDMDDEENEMFTGDTTINKHKIDSKNQTVRPEIAAGSVNEPSDSDPTFQGMPANADDLIKGFRSEEVGGKIPIAPKFEDPGQDEDESPEEDHEEEETARVEHPPGAEKLPSIAGTAADHRDTSQEVRQRSGYDHGTVQAPLSGGAPQNEVNADEGVDGKPWLSPSKGVDRGKETGSGHHYDSNAAETGVDESHEEPEEEGNSDNESNMESDSGTDKEDKTKSSQSEEKIGVTQGAADSVTSGKSGAPQSSTKYNGSKQGIVNGHNTTQLSLMVYKIAKTEKVFSLAAAPCREVSSWMPEVVLRLEVELPGLQFYCIDMDDTGTPMDDLKEAFGDVSGGFMQSSPEEIDKVIPNNLDLVISWMGMQRWGIRKSWRFIKGLRRSGVRMALFSNNPMSGNGNSASKTINIRKSPLLFKEPQRVIGKVSSDDATQLLLYSMDGLREGF